MHGFSVTITKKRTSETQSLSGAFSDNEWSRLLQFKACASRLAATGLLQKGVLPNYGFRWDHEFGVSHIVTLPGDDDVASFLHRMRPFVLKKNEPAYFNAISNIITRRLALPFCVQAVQKQRDRFACKQLGFSIQAGPLVLTSELALDKWLNAFEYHRDPQKQAELTTLYETFPEPAARALFLNSLLEKAAAVLTLAGLIEAIEKRQGATRDL